jgi:hypothetical protein
MSRKIYNRLSFMAVSWLDESTLISGHLTRSVFDRYNIVDETDLAEATRKIEARNQPSISADESHTKLTHDNVRVS